MYSGRAGGARAQVSGVIVCGGAGRGARGGHRSSGRGTHKLTANWYNTNQVGKGLRDSNTNNYHYTVRYSRPKINYLLSTKRNEEFAHARQGKIELHLILYFYLTMHRNSKCL